MQTYLVGGAVRDQLLDRPVTERDYVVVGATETQMLEMGFTRVGKDFPVFLHPQTKEEYALARTERKKGHGYHGFECHAAPDVTLEQDLQRRDLTINAMAMDERGQLIDPYGGQSDLEARVFRHVSNAFSEDPLRVFRVARFMARYKGYGFTLAAETLALMRNMAVEAEIKAIAAERVWQETARALMEPHPFTYFDVLAQTDCLAFWFPGWRSANAEKAAKIEAQFTSFKATLPQRFACMSYVLQQYEDSASLISEMLRIPNDCAWLARALQQEARCWLDDTETSAENVLQSFNRIDLWRRQTRLDDLLHCLTMLQPDAANRLRDIQKAAHAAAAVDVQHIIQQGFSGAHIKPELEKARLKAIQTQLKAN
ncbi:hypothetical protein [Alteromonas oceanisediminis]|uniref:hypothetical protein n=1 Tax=Alteromonas oceanisediminis TaxID=2836180 RepID=UPI001BD9CC4D|nr:hypothetical protein [Alteromonas oceanisediminis]MBT0585093.1 hypothetical protein [Alteromonas oceanisediminis]